MCNIASCCPVRMHGSRHQASGAAAQRARRAEQRGGGRQAEVGSESVVVVVRGGEGGWVRQVLREGWAADKVLRG